MIAVWPFGDKISRLVTSLIAAACTASSVYLQHLEAFLVVVEVNTPRVR